MEETFTVSLPAGLRAPATAGGEETVEAEPEPNPKEVKKSEEPDTSNMTARQIRELEIQRMMSSLDGPQVRLDEERRKAAAKEGWSEVTAACLPPL